MVNANLIVTFDPTHGESAKAEINTILKKTDPKLKIIKSDEGLAEISVKDAREAVKAAAKAVKSLNCTFHWVPIDKWCKASVADMQKAIKDAAKEIGANEKWKMDLSMHKSKEHERGLIIKLTDVVNNPKVDLEKPDRIIKVFIVGDRAGISLLKKDELLNAAK